MAENRNGKKPKLEKHLAYGIVFGSLGGVFLSLIGYMIDSVFLQIAGVGFGLSFGILIAALLSTMESKK